MTASGGAPGTAGAGYRAAHVGAEPVTAVDLDALERLAAALAEHQALVGPRDHQRPNVWFRWCVCGWDGGPLAAGEASNDNRSYRTHIAAVLLADGGVVQALMDEHAAAELAEMAQAARKPCGWGVRAVDADDLRARAAALRAATTEDGTA